MTKGASLPRKQREPRGGDGLRQPPPWTRQTLKTRGRWYTRSHRREAGFTLLELLVAAGITALLAGLMVSVAVNVTGFWGRIAGRLSCETQSRHVLDQLALDLSSAHFRDTGAVWMAGDATNDSVGNIWLRFFTTKRGSNLGLGTTSAPVAVSYRVRRREGGSTTPMTVYLLERVEVRPGQLGSAIDESGSPGTLESGYDITGPAYSFGAGAATNDPGRIQLPGDGDDLSAVIAENVVGFEVTFYVRDGAPPNGLRLIFPVSDGLADVAPLRGRLPPQTALTAGDYAPGFLFPEVVDISLRVLTDEGGRLVAAYEQLNPQLLSAGKLSPSHPWWRIVEAHSHVFSRRVVTKVQPL